jgi:hypothetical protein
MPYVYIQYNSALPPGFTISSLTLLKSPGELLFIGNIKEEKYLLSTLVIFILQLDIFIREKPKAISPSLPIYLYSGVGKLAIYNVQVVPLLATGISPDVYTIKVLF